LTDPHLQSHAVSRYDYDLPEELIAQTPIEPRDAARMLVLHREHGSIEDRQFRDLPSFLRPGDLIVANDTRVMPARLIARRESGGQAEFLLLSRDEDQTWLAMARPARRLRDGEWLALLDIHDAETGDSLQIVGREGDQVRIRLENELAIQRHGRVPLPPYIRTTLNDPDRYQTVYAQHTGSAAAPTAGMHFTNEVIERCEAAGATFATVTLHVGLDTFQPIKSDDVRDHEMHSEWFIVPDPETIRRAKQEGRRVIAIGTTSVRTLEAAGLQILDEHVSLPISGSTSLFITPGYQFQIVDAMLTNFHLPRTTLMLLVSAFAGEEPIRRAYAHAIQRRYRFLSFGDAMLIV
jgi:S-adenosylmethionine:tRNA ribosyltransferase-isomerase